jgi:hypothetical protein
MARQLCQSQTCLAGTSCFRIAANKIRVCVARDRFDHFALLLGAIEFYHEALHVEGLHSAGEGRSGQLGRRLSMNHE